MARRALHLAYLAPDRGERRCSPADGRAAAARPGESLCLRAPTARARSQGVLSFEFQLSDREFSRAWLTEYFRRPGLGLFRAVAGPTILVFGFQIARDAHDTFGRAIGVLAMALGLWHVVRPFVLVRAHVKKRRESGAAQATMRVRVDESGVRVGDGNKETRLGWDAITAAGKSADYVWFEIRRSARGTIPLRAVGEREAELIEAFRARGKWR